MVSSLFGRDRSAGSGTYIFYYRGVRDDQRKYPFTLEITPSQIVFFYSGRSFFSGENDLVSEQKKRWDYEDYVSHPVLTIPTFPSSLEGRNSEAEIIAIFNDFILVQKSLEDNRKFTTFSNLQPIQFEGAGEIIANSQWDNTDGNKRSTDKFQLRQLLLDFLFELRHETTFHENLPPDIYSALTQWVEKYFILKAILAKYEYYYHRELVEQDWKDKIAGRTSLSEAELFLEAEYEWVSVMCSPEAGTIFYTTDWFLDVEDEMKALHSMDDLCKRRCISRLKYQKEKPTDKHNFLRNRIDQSFEQIVMWWASRHHYPAAYREVSRVLKFNKWFNWRGIVIFFLLAIVASIVAFPQYIFVAAIGYFLLWAIGLGAAVLSMMGKKKKVSLLALVFPATNTRMFLSTASFWIIIASTKDTWEMVFEMDFDLFWVSSFFILAFTILLATYDVIVVTRSRRVTRVGQLMGRVIMLVFSGAFYAMLSGILIQEFLAKRTIVSSEINEELRYKTLMHQKKGGDTDVYRIGLNLSDEKSVQHPPFAKKREHWSIIRHLFFSHPVCKKIFPDTLTKPLIVIDKPESNSRAIVMDSIAITTLTEMEEKDRAIVNYCNHFDQYSTWSSECPHFTERIHRQALLGGYIFPAFLIMGSLLSVFFSMIAIVLSEKRKLG